MTEEPQVSTRRSGIAFDSDWITTAGMLLLLVACLFWFVADVRRLIWDHLTGPAQIHPSFWSIWNLTFDAIAAILLLIFATKLTQTFARVGCVLMGTRLAIFALLSCLNISAAERRVAAVSGSIIGQIALLIFCAAIVQWLKGVVRSDRRAVPEGVDR